MIFKNNKKSLMLPINFIKKILLVLILLLPALIFCSEKSDPLKEDKLKILQYQGLVPQLFNFLNPQDRSILGAVNVGLNFSYRLTHNTNSAMMHVTSNFTGRYDTETSTPICLDDNFIFVDPKNPNQISVLQNNKIQPFPIEGEVKFMSVLHQKVAFIQTCDNNNYKNYTMFNNSNTINFEICFTANIPIFSIGILKSINDKIFFILGSNLNRICIVDSKGILPIRYITTDRAQNNQDFTHHDVIRSLLLLSRNRLVTNSSHGNILAMFDLNNLDGRTFIAKYTKDEIVALANLDENRFLSQTSEGEILIWNVEDEHPSLAHRITTDFPHSFSPRVSSLIVSPNRYIILRTRNGLLARIDSDQITHKKMVLHPNYVQNFPGADGRNIIHADILNSGISDIYDLVDLKNRWCLVRNNLGKVKIILSDGLISDYNEVKNLSEENARAFLAFCPGLYDRFFPKRGQSMADWEKKKKEVMEMNQDALNNIIIFFNDNLEKIINSSAYSEDPEIIKYLAQYAGNTFPLFDDTGKLVQRGLSVLEKNNLLARIETNPALKKPYLFFARLVNRLFDEGGGGGAGK